MGEYRRVGAGGQNRVAEGRGERGEMRGVGRGDGRVGYVR